MSKPLRVTKTAQRVAPGLYSEDTEVESQQLLYLNGMTLFYKLMDYIQLRIFLHVTVIQYKIDVLDVKSWHSAGGVVTGATSWTTQGSNPVMKTIFFSSSNLPGQLWSPSNL